ncbi:gamma-soluble NSF attachment protein [Gossypium hirsutum]|uniref:Gamma-soluble NSF attachment protein n=1 Tax=Gossypium hirsutum TaxID=3635 RepID=A0ABM3BL62_GOSHI|nr:gamma-soluble NSF attachment protein-like [Gossypium hirsutum]
MSLFIDVHVPCSQWISISKIMRMLSGIREASKGREMYPRDACVLLEDDRKEQMALDLYHAVTNIYVKLEKYTDAVAFLLKLGLAADKCNATNSQCKAYLSAVIVYLYAHDLKQAEKCYNDCSQIDAFLRSDQNRFAGKLLSAYREGDVEEIKRVSQSRSITILNLRGSLPTGDVAAFKTNAAIGEGEALDENDLT